jgi:DNA polymerase
MHANDDNELIADIREHLQYMKELGVEFIDFPLPEPMADVASKNADKITISPVPRKEAQTNRPGSRLSALPSLRDRRPIDNGGDRRRNITAERPLIMDKEEKPSALRHTTDVLPLMNETMDTIESIRAEIGECTRCPLHAQGRKQIVHTTGNFNAELMFIGEAPGADEDEQGFPFVGRAGQLLTKIIESIGLRREDVCIGNINRCRPPENRKPEPKETEACRPFILREIAIVKPKVVVVLGATAAHNLLQVKTPISKLRGYFHDYFGVKVMPTFHPAYLLRDPHKKKEVWEDMKKVREMLTSVVR